MQCHPEAIPRDSTGQFDDPSKEEAKAHEPMCKLLEIACDLRAKELGLRPRRGHCSGAPWAAACRL
jgi:hypothetical protein